MTLNKAKATIVATTGACEAQHLVRVVLETKHWDTVAKTES